MKKLYSILHAVMLVSIVGTAIFLILSPDRVPIHWNAAGEIDGMGSKYVFLFAPLISLVTYALFLLAAGSQRNYGEAANERIIVYAGIGTLIFITVVNFPFMFKALKYEPLTAPKASLGEVGRFMTLGTGALLIFLGNIMPKARRNAIFGVRTEWSMANDTVWQKTQRFGGIVSVISGLVLILLAPFLSGPWPAVGVMVVSAFLAAASIMASRRYYLDDLRKKNEH